jgi:hypothetical protein
LLYRDAVLSVSEKFTYNQQQIAFWWNPPPNGTFPACLESFLVPALAYNKTNQEWLILAFSALKRLIHFLVESHCKCHFSLVFAENSCASVGLFFPTADFCSVAPNVAFLLGNHAFTAKPTF